MPRIAFVCVENAGRSQMAAAFAERAVVERDLDVEVESGGTDPAASVHDIVVEVMRERGIDLSGRQPREVTPGELRDADHVVTMGCSADVCPATAESRDWDLDDPADGDVDTVRAVRDEIEHRVDALLDELAARE